MLLHLQESGRRIKMSPSLYSWEREAQDKRLAQMHTIYKWQNQYPHSGLPSVKLGILPSWWHNHLNFLPLPPLAPSAPLQLPPVSAQQEHMCMNNSTVGKAMFFMWTLLFSTPLNLKSWVQMCDTQHNSHLWPVGLRVHSYSINADQEVQGIMTWHDPLDPMLQS